MRTKSEFPAGSARYAVATFGDDWRRVTWIYRHATTENALDHIRDQLMMRRCANATRRHGRSATVHLRAVLFAGVRI